MSHPPVPLPFLPGEVGNGEFVPAPPTKRDAWITYLTLARVAEAADRLRVDRRRLLQSASGMAAMLGVVNLAACSSDSSPGAAPPSSPTGPPDPTTSSSGTFVVPEPEDVEMCAQVLGDQGEFIFDVHTHHVVPDGPWRQNAPRIANMIRDLVPDGCTEADPYDCLNRISYLSDLFLASDTTVALLSDVPNSGPDDAPMPFGEAVRTREFADALTTGGARRVFLHNVIAPNFGDLAVRIDDMEAQVATGKVDAFKVYTAWGPGRQGFALDDPALGIPVIEQARALGVKVFCGHKGLPLLEFDRRFNGPRDMVAVATQYPDMDFVVYHAAFERETQEGPYDPDNAGTGVNSLVKAMQDYGVPPNSNVWAELGTTWREVMDDPDQAAHVLGKLLLHVGEDRILWGTDAIWFGSPQPQIMALRAFRIEPAARERWGYPELTDTIKRKILGLNAAALFGVDPDATRCALAPDGLEAGRADYASLVASGAIPAPWKPRGPVTRRQMLDWLRTAATPSVP